MKKTITFSNNTAVLERTGSTATIVITTIPENTPFPTEIAQLADRLNEFDFIYVMQIFPRRGKIVFTVDKAAPNADVINVVCDCITCVYNTDTVVK